MRPKNAKRRNNASKKIQTVRHKDKRKNIPTEELRDFVREDEQQPKKVLYPRDPDLDPQLVWHGKDEQDARPLEVPAVPIYIQEKIHPQAIIEDFRRTAAKPGQQDNQLDLFSDFNDLPEDFADRIDFYHHEGNWSNRLILGDSLLVMTSLAEKEALKGKVQMIYIDPPYGIKFGSNWQVSTRKRDVKDGKAGDVTRQPEQVKAFRDTWKLGIHSYLAYLRDRLVVARDLLTETGSVFVQMGDENVHLVRCLLDEVFGSDNFCGVIAAKKTSASTEALLPSVTDYVLWYAREKDNAKYRQLFIRRELGEGGTAEYRYVLLPDGGSRSLTGEESGGLKPLVAGARPFRPDNLTSSHHYSMGESAFAFHGREFTPGVRYWTTSPNGMSRLGMAGRLIPRKNDLAYRRFLDDFPIMPVSNVWMDVLFSSRSEQKIYVVQTSAKIVQRCLLMTTDPGDLVLDPTCGSGTTAYVAEQCGRRWITIDSSRVALTLARTRLMAARFAYYILVDSPEGIEKKADILGKLPPRPAPKTAGDVRRGFVYERVPHVTLKAIANNEEIDEIHAKWEEELEPLRAKLNKLLKKKWQEWEIPREAENAWPAEAKKLLRQWWEHRTERQAEIDKSIARKANSEILYDRPYVDKKTVRVTGPFTVESLSPHRTISIDEKAMLVAFQKEGWRTKTIGPDDFGRIILDNLCVAGVQNTIRGERLRFDTLEPYANPVLHGRGEYTERDGKRRRVAVCIGPEHGTVGSLLVKEAAKEAVQGVGFDVLIVCGFAFDPTVNEEAKRYGKLVVLPTKMNPDLGMGELLKKTGSGNLFMVFGEPDIDIRTDKDGRLTAQIKGLDVYDPTTGEIRSSSTDDIACWFIDTNYDGESFFVRHAYFTGADEPYDKLKRALRAEIDEAAWSELYSTTSRPFDKPETGKMAVKLINHYGDEVLKVYEV